MPRALFLAERVEGDDLAGLLGVALRRLALVLRLVADQLGRTALLAAARRLRRIRRLGEATRRLAGQRRGLARRRLLELQPEFDRGIGEGGDRREGDGQALRPV